MKFAISFLVFLVAIQCAPVEESTVNPPESPTPASKISEFDAEIKAFRTADFDYIFVFRRNDGEPMDSDDKMIVRNNSHFATNRFTLSKDEKVIFAGSNYKFKDAGLEALKERFDVSDFSKTDEEIKTKKEELKKKERKSKAKQLAPRKAERRTK